MTTEQEIRLELINKLKELQDEDDHEVAHLHADELLLAYINDKEISEAYEDILKWYD